MSSAAVSRGEIFPRRSSRGVVLGLSGPALVCVLAGAVIAVFSMPIAGGLRGLVVTAPVWVLLLVLGLVPMGAGGKLVDWMPVGVSYVYRRLSGQHQWRRPVWRTRPAGTLALAGSRARLRLFLDERDSTAFIHDPHKHTLTATCKVTHGQFMMSDADKQDEMAAGYADLLASLGQADGVCRIQVQQRSMADGGVGVQSHWDQWQDKAPQASTVRRNYEALLRRSTTATEQHESTITITLDLDAVSGAVKSYGGGLRGGAAVLRQRMRLLEDHLPAAGLTSRGWITPSELAVVIRTAYDPGLAVRLQQHPEEAGDLPDAGAMAVDNGWASMHTDTGWHQVLQIGRWPRLKVVPGFLHPLVLVPGVKLSMSLIYRPIETARAVKDAQHDDAREAEAREDRRKIGRRDTIIHRRERAQAERHLADLDDGHSDMDHVALIAVSAPDREALDRAVEDVRSAIRRAKCTPRTLYAQQDELFDAAALPLGLGMR
ncbi:SCO6880 family protein [Actinomyces sp.]|uniref:SCO6880 family protein n=1 Tax=Actinomyces sp. TaxID=29317 RepID=UPI0026DC4D93|nr:SCO6880 family protein [Actinomyces sp.]MDO4899447.1 hypothetical protein [Actinomyces sp.]